MTPEVNGEEVDMEVSQVGISYAIGDPLEPGIIAGTQATTFRMPATNKVRALLGGPGMSERPISGATILQFKKGGVVYLEQGIRPIEWTREEVRCVSVGNNAGWISDLKNVKLNELDLGESPRIEGQYVIDSWFSTDELLYFPMIDYGYPWLTTIAALTKDFRPGLRCHRLLKKAFADLGYSIKIRGGLNAVWKRYVLPCVEEVKAGKRDTDNSTMTVEQLGVSGTFVAPSTFGQRTLLPPSASVTLTDVGGNATLLGVTAGSPPFTVPAFTAQLDMRMRIVVDMVIRSQEPFAISELVLRAFNPGTNTPWADINYPITIPPMGTKTLTGVVVGEVDILATDTIALAMYAQPTPYTWNFSIDSATVRYVPANIPYQENITITIAEAAPKITAWDLLQGINYNRCLAFDTDDRTKVVTISYHEEKYRPIAEGISLVGREDHTDPPVKGNPLKCKRIVFGWKDDADDFYLDRANESAGARGYGGLLRDIEGGTLKEKKVEMPFAATAMRAYVGGLFLPVMRENEVRDAVPGEEDRNFKRTPRLLLTDGIGYNDDNGWTINGLDIDFYPKCFFVYPGETDLCMSFYPETLYGSCGPGMVASHYGPYLRRLEKSKTLSIDLMLYDHELKGLDLGVPVEVLDDFTANWYYITEVKQKKFDVDEPTRCELIQV